MQTAGSSEAAYWQQRYAVGDTPWDKGVAHPALEVWLQKNPPAAGAKVLVPGCGSGHEVRAWEAAGARAVGLDIAPGAVDLASSFGGSGVYHTGSIFAPPAGWQETFDWIFEHTCFCAFEPKDRPLYARSIDKLLRPGGCFLAIFYMRPDHDESPPYGSEEAELLELFAPGLRPLSRHIAEPTFPGREGREEVWLWKKNP
jgi:SAM-dependent methyltransferase